MTSCKQWEHCEEGVKRKFLDENVSSLGCHSFETPQMQSSLSLDMQSIIECCLRLTLRCLRAKHLACPCSRESTTKTFASEEYPTCDILFDDTCDRLTEI